MANNVIAMRCRFNLIDHYFGKPIIQIMSSAVHTRVIHIGILICVYILACMCSSPHTRSFGARTFDIQVYR